MTEKATAEGGLDTTGLGATGPTTADPDTTGLDSVPVLELDPLIDDLGTRIIVCCGAGGVGKTTTAAALGVRAAERGRRVVVLTIDPARRLAQSMGIDSLDNTPARWTGSRGPTAANCTP